MTIDQLTQALRLAGRPDGGDVVRQHTWTLSSFCRPSARRLESRVKSIKADADDYWIADLNWADHQEPDTKLCFPGSRTQSTTCR